MKYLKAVRYDPGCEKAPYFQRLLEELKKNEVQVLPFKSGGTVQEGSLLILRASEKQEMPAQIPGSHPYVCWDPDGSSKGLKESWIRKAQCIIEGFDEVDADFLEKMFQRGRGIPWTIAETERLILREFSVEDHCHIFPEISTDPEFTSKYIENMYGIFGYGIWAVVLKETGQIIGRAGVYDCSALDGFELGYAIDSPFRQKGYAHEACGAALDFAENRLGLKEIYALIEPANQESIRVALSLGFRQIMGKSVKDERTSGELLVFFRSVFVDNAEKSV